MTMSMAHWCRLLLASLADEVVVSRVSRCEGGFLCSLVLWPPLRHVSAASGAIVSCEAHEGFFGGWVFDLRIFQL
jgi:hypothetical protein